ncbi:unnamed protein product [Cochlearia groenlandica]
MATKNNYGDCAACKLKQRGCSPDCLLRHYFPPHGGASTHLKGLNNLFGVDRIRENLQKLPPQHRDDHMNACIFQFLALERDPIHGTLSILKNHIYDIELKKAELRQLRIAVRSYNPAAVFDPIDDFDEAAVDPVVSAAAEYEKFLITNRGCFGNFEQGKVMLDPSLGHFLEQIDLSDPAVSKSPTAIAAATEYTNSNDDYFPGISSDGTNDSRSGGGYFGDFADKDSVS